MAGKVFPEDILRAWNTRQRARLSSMFYELRNGKAEGTNERTNEGEENRITTHSHTDAAHMGESARASDADRPGKS